MAAHGEVLSYDLAEFWESVHGYVKRLEGAAGAAEARDRSAVLRGESVEGLRDARRR